jgi:hypothetical protein
MKITFYMTGVNVINMCVQNVFEKEIRFAEKENDVI